MATIAITPEAVSMPYDLANVPVGYWDRATNPQRMRDMKISGSRDVMPIPPNAIKVDPSHNPRDYRLPENRAHLDDLKRKIKAAGGVLRPLECRWDFLEPGDTTKSIIVCDGECRLRATLELIDEGMEIASVPVMQSDAKNEGDRLIQALMLNEGKPLSQWEMGNAFKRFVRMGWTMSKIVERTGHTQKYIAHAIEMADAPDEVKEMLSAQAVTPSHALSVLRTMESSSAVHTLKAQVAAKVASGETGPVKRAKVPSAAKEEAKNTSALVLYAAEEMAKALDSWREDATDEAESKLISSHEAYRKLIRAPKREEVA